MIITIKPAQLEQASNLAKLSRQLGYEVTEQQTAEWLSDLLKSEIHQVFVAVAEQQQVCGWLVVEKRISLEAGYKAEITGLVVEEGFRRLGVAKQLVRSAAEWAITMGLSRMVVRSNAQRESSHQFYQSIGFCYTKTAHNYQFLLS